MSFVIDVCVCTFRRLTLIDTLRSIARQQLPAGSKLRVIVADNDELPSARILVGEAATSLELDCVYVHAPARNISVARNACLATATAPLIAFIDDDEIAADDWLGKLIQSQSLSGVAVTFGPVRAIYATGPAWLRKADLHSIQPVVRKGGLIVTGYTSNVLINREVIAEALKTCSFDPNLGRSGGEDSAFFHALFEQGVRLGFCPDALVSEVVPPNRAKMAWLIKRSFRSGQTHCRMLLTGNRRRPAIAAVAVAKLGYSLTWAIFGFASPTGWRRDLVRGALHAGVVAGSIGLRDLQLY